MFSKVVSNAQKRIEGNNFDSRKNVLKYDEVLRKQREMFYGQRREVIEREDITEVVNPLIRACVENVCDRFIEEVGRNIYVSTAAARASPSSMLNTSNSSATCIAGAPA